MENVEALQLLNIFLSLNDFLDVVSVSHISHEILVARNQGRTVSSEVHAIRGCLGRRTLC